MHYAYYNRIERTSTIADKLIPEKSDKQDSLNYPIGHRFDSISSNLATRSFIGSFSARPCACASLLGLVTDCAAPFAPGAAPDGTRS